MTSLLSHNLAFSQAINMTLYNRRSGADDRYGNIHT